MNTAKSAFNRTVTFLLALGFGAAGVWGVGLALDTSWARRVGEYADRTFWTGLETRENYADILRIAALVLVFLGLTLIVVNLERKRLGPVTSPTSGTTGAISIHPADLASAVAQSLEQVPGVRSSAFRAVEDRSAPVLEIRLLLTPEADIRTVRDACVSATRDIEAALPGQDLRPRFLLRAEQVRHTAE